MNFSAIEPYGVLCNKVVLRIEGVLYVKKWFGSGRENKELISLFKDTEKKIVVKDKNWPECRCLIGKITINRDRNDYLLKDDNGITHELGYNDLVSLWAEVKDLRELNVIT
ncbi:MAG: hypothetical protein ABIA78_01040 [archaeon]